MKSLGLDIRIAFGNVSLALTDESTDNHRLVDFGVAGQKITVLKNDQDLQANICGVTVNTHYRFDKIYNFVKILGKTVQVYAENMAVQIAIEEYKKFIKDTKKVKTLYPDSL